MRSPVIPNTLYEVEIWTCYMVSKCGNEGKCCIPWTARHINVSISKGLTISEKLSTTFRKRILFYFDYIARKTGETKEPGNQRNIIGTRTLFRWSDQKIKLTGSSLNIVFKLVQNREGWRRIVYRIPDYRNE